jgi:hypothetical protein
MWSVGFIILSVAAIVWKVRFAKWSELSKSAVLTVASTFLGVFLALFASSEQETSGTHERLIRVAEAAQAELMVSGRLISAPVGESHGDRDRQRLLLEKPASGLDVLVAMPEFLEHGEPKSLPELLTVSTTLSWQAVFATAGGRGGPSSGAGSGVQTADPGFVLHQLQRAKELLDEQMTFLQCQRSLAQR